jgi:hypothetical protein
MATTIKCSFGRLNCPPRLKEYIERYVQTIHPLSIRGAWLAQTHVLRCLEHNETLPSFDQTFFYQCFKLHPGTSNASLRYTYQHYHTPIEPAAQFDDIPIRQFLPRPLNSACRQYKSAVRNHIGLNFFKRVLQYLKRKLHIYNVSFRADVLNAKYKFFKGAMKHIQGMESLSLESLVEEYVYTNGQLFLNNVLATIQQWKRTYTDVFPLYGTYSCLRHWDKLVPWVYELRKDLDKDLAVHFPNETGQIKGLYKQFALFPQPLLAIKHLTLDTSTLVDVLYAMRNDGFEVDNNIDRTRYINGLKRFVDMTRPEFRANQTEHWKEIFPGIQRLLTGQKEFTGCIRTDGISACVLCERAESDHEESVGDKRMRCDGESTEEVFCIEDNNMNRIEHINRLIAIDPGRRDIVTAQYYNDDQEKMGHMNISNGTFNHWRGTKHIRRQQNRRKDAHGLTEMRQLPSGKVIQLVSWMNYLQNVHRWIPSAFPYYQSKTTRRIRLETYKREYKALDRCCREITKHQGTFPVIAFGHNEATSGFGYASAPCQALKRRLQQKYAHVVEVDEYGTSKYCCYCHCCLHDAVFQNKRSTEFKVCPNCLNSIGCKLHIHRDINASINIGTLFWARFNGQERPHVFQRNSS